MNRGLGRRIWGRAAVLATVLGGVVVLNAGPPATALSSTGIRAVGAESEYANVIAQLGGHYVHVTAVMSNPATDPHSYEVSTRVAQSIAGANLVVQNGDGYDNFMSQLESAAPNSHRLVIVVQSVLGLSSATRNPHLWYDPSTMPRVASNIERALVTLEPTHAAYFERRLRTFRASLTSLSAAVTAFRTRFAGAKVATTEPVANFLLAALGLVNLTPFRFQADIMNGVDPSPEDIANQQALFTKHKVKLLCFNAQVSSSVTVALRDLAQHSRIPVVAVYETMPAPGYNFQTWMLAEINAMTKALTSSTSTTVL
jgi:zinc/manganese transport system substrate-binding protein